MMPCFARKMKRYCKIFSCILILSIIVFYVNSKLNRKEKTAPFKAYEQRNNEHQKPKSVKKSKSAMYEDFDDFYPNSIHAKDSRRKFQKLNKSDSLVHKLKPKLIQPITPLPRDSKSDDDGLWLGELGVAKNEEELKSREVGYDTFAFNTLVSSRIGLLRALPDTRHKQCNGLVYSNSLPSASVIICYYHEDLGVLLRTIHSVLERTPQNLLKEILIINDQSDIDISYNVSQHIGKVLCE